MISETQTQSVEVPTVEEKNGAPKRNYKKKEPKAVETVAIVAKAKRSSFREADKVAQAKPKREKKQPTAQSEPTGHTSDVDEEYTKIKNLIESDPSIAEEFQSIINKHLK